MNAYELANELSEFMTEDEYTELDKTIFKAVTMLRQQADRIAELEKFISDLKNITNAQGQKGCWDVDNYMTGLFNGLEMALSIFEQREPQFKDTTPQTKPLSDEEIKEVWLKRPANTAEDVVRFARAIEERHGIK